VHFLHEIEELNPLSMKYLKYWKDIKRRCIEGYWFEGKWMPGNLYFYVNCSKIELNKTADSKNKVVARPFLRDLEWEKAYVYAEARGFSGFAEDGEESCHPIIKTISKLDNWKDYYTVPKECFKTDGTLKKFVPAREYLRRIHSTNLGRPLYQANSLNVIDIEARGGGKSFNAANAMILHNFLMDGATDYDLYLKGLESGGDRFTSETLVGAVDAKYSKSLLNKVQIGMDALVGEQIFQGQTFPSPLSKAFTGSWFSGKQFIEAKVDKYVGGKWKRVGSGSKVYHRSFKDDPFSGNGTRSSLICLEEVGFFSNLKETLGALKDTTYNGNNKFGTIYAMGTGGDMGGGSSEAAMEVFNDPFQYDCLVFNDIWEDTGSIGFFIPYEMTLNEYKDSEGNTDWVKATNAVDIKREDLKKGKSKKPLYDEMQNNPRTPSEAFLTINSNIFPVGELKEHLGWLRSHQQDAFIKGQNGELVWEQAEGQPAPNVKWIPDIKNKLTPCGYKMKKTDDTQGCIQIWEHPQYINGQIPYGQYIAGCLLPGEKVLTDKGLMNVEQVSSTEKLINKEGNLVDIINFQIREKVSHDCFKLKMSHTYRTTTFTRGHPLYVSKTGYNPDNTINEEKFDFTFVRADKVSAGDWTKWPNVYKSINTFDIDSLWINEGTRIDKQIESPLNDKDFWWFVGLWLGDGWCEKNGYRICVAINSKEETYLTKLRKIVKLLFNRSLSIRERNGVIECSFSSTQLSAFLTLHFAKYAKTKILPEWVKRLSETFKPSLVQGYLDSDGCITKNGVYYSMEFVSINLMLLEGIQDILFSLGVVGNITKMRDAKLTKILGKTVSQQKTYHLRYAHHDTLQIVNLIADREDLKIKRIDFTTLPTVRKRPKDGCFISADGNYIYFQIREMERFLYTGLVYNFECDTHNYISHHITQHNCDPYDQDQSVHTSSLGSTFIYKTFNTQEGIFEWPVAEYTARPATADEHHENVRKLLTYYNATCLYENERNSLKMHFSNKHSLHLLAKTPTILKSTEGSKVQRGYGTHMTAQIKDELEIYTRDWLMQDAGDGKLNLHKIYSQPLLEELIYYNKEGNFDRVISYILTICHRLMNYHIKVEAVREDKISTDDFFRRTGNFYK
jgi:hypothetical protein